MFYVHTVPVKILNTLYIKCSMYTQFLSKFSLPDRTYELLGEYPYVATETYNTTITYV
jgi:hypothetical protein